MVFPQDYKESDLGNTRTCLKWSGKLLLDSYYNLNKSDPSQVDLDHLTPYLECSLFMLQVLLCFKQRLFDSNKLNTVATKPHMVLHFILFTIFLGCIKNFDTATMEHTHRGKLTRSVYNYV